jgi:glycogen debranching enzyme
MKDSPDKDSSTASVLDSRYVVDTRGMSQGTQFVLTDEAHPRTVLKHGSHFLVVDQSGNIPHNNTLGYGYYRYDTRHVSQWEILIDDASPSLLSSSSEGGFVGTFLYTNPQTANLPQQKITINRDIVLADLLWQRFVLQNFHNEPLSFALKMRFQSDFADMFEVRGLNRSSRGEMMVPLSSADGRSHYLAYRGEDGMLLETAIEFIDILPDVVNEGELVFHIHLPARQRRTFEIRIATKWDGHQSSPAHGEHDFATAKVVAEERCRDWYQQVTHMYSSNELFNRTMQRGLRDIYILRQPTPKGFGFGAGVPWYCAVFGRDSAITAMQVLPFAPDVARECIEVLAAYQGQLQDDFRAEMPGRIMHEIRFGELARTKHIPHSPYFGAVDSTQLWLILLCQYVQWTGDLQFARDMWPAVKLALNWLDETTDGEYLTYKRMSAEGLENQGWKDSGDSVMHVDGTLALPPIAICEAQAYLYAARIELSHLATVLGHGPLAQRLLDQAESLKKAFIRDFWMADENFVALALDANFKQVGVMSSNPGHCLFTGILDDDKANAVADRLLSKELLTDWGIRTLSSSTVAFNPMSYHNGSIWPHDNAIIAEGFRKLGRVADVHKIMKSLFDMAQHEPDFRLPELVCGFDRDGADTPINYPVSCSPQAWAAGSMFQIVKACINLQPDAYNNRVRIVEPSLPDWLENLTIRGLRVGNASFDLSLAARSGTTFCQLLRKSGNLRVIVEN